MPMTTETLRAPAPPKEAVLETAGVALVRGILRTMAMDPREAAETAYIHRVTPSIDELEAQIRRFHAEAEARGRHM